MVRISSFHGQGSGDKNLSIPSISGTASSLSNNFLSVSSLFFHRFYLVSNDLNGYRYSEINSEMAKECFSADKF